MDTQLDREQVSRLWEHGLHEDNIFNDRLNFFLVFESVLLGAVGVLYSTAQGRVEALRAIMLFGLLLTLIWAYIQARQKYVLDGVKARVRATVPEYHETLQIRERGRWPVSAMWLLAYAIPALVALIWVALLFML